MNLLDLSKRAILSLLLIFPIYAFSIDKNFYENNVWKSLLHLDKNNHPSINTPTFLFSYEDFSPKNEFYKTIEAFKEDNKNICKYPARYLWISKNTDIKLNNFDFKTCKEFSKYKKNTNPNNISLIFVSEDVSNPTSMMGHIFFKLEGVNDKGNIVENAVSFFTVIDTLNLPYLAIESTIIGMKGYFILKPYKKQISQYIKNENRNIWEYSLELTSQQIKLLSYHFWELKDVDIKYYFTKYNCATIIDDMINIISSNNRKNNNFNIWTTPKDVIKRVSDSKLIKETNVRRDTFINKNPIYSQGDSQISLYKKSDDEALYLSFLPASHTLYDDNRQYSFESSLKIGEISFKIRDNDIKVNQLNLLSYQLLTPLNENNNDLSKELSINYTEHLDMNLELENVYNFYYAMGLTYKINKDIFIYDLIGIGLAYGKNSSYIYSQNKLGLIIYEVFNMKSIFEYTTQYNTFKSKEYINSFDFTQSIKVLKDTRLDIRFQDNKTNRYKDKNLKIGLTYIF